MLKPMNMLPTGQACIDSWLWLLLLIAFGVQSLARAEEIQVKETQSIRQLMSQIWHRETFSLAILGKRYTQFLGIVGFVVALAHFLKYMV